MAVSGKPTTLAYRFRGSAGTAVLGGGGSCTNAVTKYSGTKLTSLTLSNQSSSTTSPWGFSVVESPRTDGSGTSPRTTATLPGPVQLVVAYPAGMVDTAAAGGGFSFTNGTATNWSAPTVRQVSMTDPAGVTQLYDVFTFTWKGNPTQSTVLDQTVTGTRPTSWAGTALTGTWAVKSTYCYVTSRTYWFTNYYTGGTATNLSYTQGGLGTFTTANGYVGQLPSNTPTTKGMVLLS